MRRPHNTAVAVLLLLALSLVMYGCGGGGSSGPPPKPPEPPMVHTVTIPDEPMVPEGVDYMVPELSIDEAVTIEAGDMEIIGYVTFSCPAGGAACVIDMDDEGNVTSTGGEATAKVDGQVTTDLQAAIDAKAEADEAARQAEIEAATKAAATKRKAIETESNQTTDAGLGGTARTDADDTTTETSDDVYELAIERDSDGMTTVEITDPHMAADDDPKFMQARDLGGGRTMHTRTMEADDDGDVVEETVIVTTDIEAARATAFARVAGQALNADEAGASATGDDATALDFTATALASTDTAAAAILAKVMSSAFEANTAAALTFSGDDPADEEDEAFETSGTYNGAMGMYKCAGGAGGCTVNINAMGKITGMSDGWIFTPDEGATSDVPDADYLHYGVWLKKTTDEDGVVTYNEVETFAGSSLAATGDVTSVTGTATYEGGATGVYEHSVKNPDGTEASATSGHFTADAELTAYFAQTLDDASTTAVDESGQIPPNLLRSISGTINNFMLSGHDEGPGWSVSLEKGAIAPSTGTASGLAKGGGAAASYSATFHGPIGDHDGDAETPAIPHPGAVVGEFNAFFSNGSVVGAFGARKQAE